MKPETDHNGELRRGGDLEHGDLEQGGVQKVRSDRRGIQSIEVGFTLIRVLSEAPAKLPLKELAARAEMAPSKAHLYLVSFIRLRLVVQDPVTARYGLGPAAIQLGVAAINQLNVVDVAHKHLEDMREETGLPVSLSIWGNRGPTIIFRLDGQLPVPLSVRVGFVLPLLSTATGRIFMAYLPKREWRSIAETENAISPGRLERTLDLLEGISEDGVARTDGQMHEGFFGISCPVFDNDDKICAAVTVLGLSSGVEAGAISPGGRAPITGAIRQAARRISVDIGCPRYRDWRHDQVMETV